MHHLYVSQRAADHKESSKRKRLEASLSYFAQRALATIHASPWLQLITVFVVYIVHLVYLTQGQWVFPIQWWALPNNNQGWRAYRHFVGIGYDSLAGIATLAIYYKRFRSHARQSLPVLVPKTMPWKFPPAPPGPAPQSNAANSTNLVEAIRRQYSWPHVVHRATFLLTSICLVNAYFATGRFSLYWHDILYELSAKGFPFTTPQFRAWSVLLGHLSWVGLGSGFLYLIPFAPRFFRRQVSTRTSNVSDKNGKKPSKPWHWFRFQFGNPSNGKSVWVWWVLGGYFVSCWLFNVADWANHYLIPEAVLQKSSESVVSQLVAPEFNDRAASLIGYVAPCLSAPLWEELLYRGFLLSGLWSCLFRHNFSLAAVVQAIVFSAHHMSLAGALPFAVLGYVWAVLYGLSGNLWTVCLVHSLWNSRIFFSSWLGL